VTRGQAEIARGRNALAAWTPPPSLERRRLQCYLATILCDLLALYAGFGVSGWLYLGGPGFTEALVLAQLLAPVYLTLALYNGTYSLASLERAGRGIERALLALASAYAIVVFVAFYAKASADLSRFALSLGGIGTAACLVWLRLQLPALVRALCGPTVINQLLIDDAGPPLDLPGVRAVMARDFGLTPDLADPQALDRIGMILRNADRVIVTCPPERRLPWAMILKGANISGEVVDAAVEELGAQGARHAGGNGLLLVSTGPLGMRARATKRLFDVAVALVGLIVLAPLLLIVAVSILLEDGRPVLFVQPRVGRANRFFRMLKFRSMRHTQADAAGHRSVSRDDERITGVGRWIRRTSIDELPQLWNVLRGDMSIVGPRPHALGSQAGGKLFWEVDPRYWQRHALRPGITGLAQVRGLRGATDAEADLAGRLNADLEYLAGWSLMRDVRIVIKTLPVLHHDRAY
jgi:lipopolysaccharide/colanic/teichoic acid biosynthesis glycosyltransferase